MTATFPCHVLVGKGLVSNLWFQSSPLLWGHHHELVVASCSVHTDLHHAHRHPSTVESLPAPRALPRPPCAGWPTGPPARPRRSLHEQHLVMRNHSQRSCSLAVE